MLHVPGICYIWIAHFVIFSHKLYLPFGNLDKEQFNNLPYIECLLSTYPIPHHIVSVHSTCSLFKRVSIVHIHLASLYEMYIHLHTSRPHISTALWVVNDLDYSKYTVHLYFSEILCGREGHCLLCQIPLRCKYLYFLFYV